MNHRPSAAILALVLVAAGAIAVPAAIHFVHEGEQWEIDRAIVAEMVGLIEARVGELAAQDPALAEVGRLHSWHLDDWGRSTLPPGPRLFIHGTAHFDKADLGCTVAVVHGTPALALKLQPDEDWLKQNPAMHVRIVGRALETDDSVSEESGEGRPARTVVYFGFDGEATHPAFAD